MKKEALVEQALRDLEKGYDGVLLIFYDKEGEKFNAFTNNPSIPLPTCMIIHSLIEAGNGYEEKEAKIIAEKLETPFVLVAKMKVDEMKKRKIEALADKKIFDFSIYIEGLKDKIFKRKVASSLLLDLVTTALGTYPIVMEITKKALDMYHIANKTPVNMNVSDVILMKEEDNENIN